MFFYVYIAFVYSYLISTYAFITIFITTPFYIYYPWSFPSCISINSSFNYCHYTNDMRLCLIKCSIYFILLFLYSTCDPYWLIRVDITKNLHFTGFNFGFCCLKNYSSIRSIQPYNKSIYID